MNLHIFIIFNITNVYINIINVIINIWIAIIFNITVIHINKIRQPSRGIKQAKSS